MCTLFFRFIGELKWNGGKLSGSCYPPDCETAGTGQEYCWEPIMKIISGSTFGYKSAYWQNDQTLNPTSPVTDTKTNAKYGAFNDHPFNMLRMCVGSPKSNSAGTNCVTHKFKKTYNSAKTFFSGGYLRDATLDQTEIESAFDASKSGRKNCGMQVCVYVVVETQICCTLCIYLDAE